MRLFWKKRVTESQPFRSRLLQIEHQVTVGFFRSLQISVHDKFRIVWGDLFRQTRDLKFVSRVLKNAQNVCVQITSPVVGRVQKKILDQIHDIDVRVMAVFREKIANDL